MNKVCACFLIVLLAFGSGCESLKDLAVIGVPMTFEKTFDVVANDSLDLSFSETELIDATENGDVATNLDNINHYEIKGVTFLISNVNSDANDPMLTDGIITLSSIDNVLIISTSFENIDLYEVEENIDEEVFNIPFTPDNLEQIGEIMGLENQINLNYEATMDTIVSFSITITIGISLKIGI